MVNRFLRVLGGILLAAVFAVPAQAQWGELAKAKPLTPAQESSLAQAKQYLASQGHSVPAGTTVGGAKVETGYGVTSSDGTAIGVDFDQIENAVPPETPGAPGKPGLLAVVLLHELKHVSSLNHSWQDEFRIQSETAGFNCQLVCDIVSVGGGPTDSLCLLYSTVRASYAIAFSAHCAGCTGIPSTLPPCECCPP